MTETQLQDAVLETARALGWLGYHTFDSRRSSAGFPDVVFVRAPRLLFVEFKAAAGALRDEQKQWALELGLVEDACASATITAPLVAYRLWRPVDWTSGVIEAELRLRG